MVAEEMVRGRMYRRTRGAWPGSHWEIPSVTSREIVKRLGDKPTLGLTTDEWVLLRDLRKGYVLVWAITRFRGGDGQVIKRKKYAPVPPDLPVREIKTMPPIW